MTAYEPKCSASRGAIGQAPAAHQLTVELTAPEKESNKITVCGMDFTASGPGKPASQLLTALL